MLAKYKFLLLLLFPAFLAWWWMRDPVLHIGADPAPGVLSVILLHGHGAPADDLRGLAIKLVKQTQSTNLCFLVPAGPYAVSMRGRTWQKQVRASSKEELQILLDEMKSESREIVFKLVRGLKDDGVSPENIFVGGFSQGAITSLDVVLDEGEGAEIGGLISLSGGARDLDLSPLEDRAALRAFVSHGTSDRVIGMGKSQILVTALEENGHDVTWIEFEGGHQIPNKIIRALAEFLVESQE
ncbi:MAG: hypothetical protein JRF33_06105 [Deltaproteobacteria bacterium]|nr:hypothetical protein [Deltaproteobacteria bacterium]